MSDDRRASLPRLDEALEVARDLGRRAFATIRSTPGLLAVSVLIAVTLWVVVTDVENPTRVDVFPASIPVEAVNVDRLLAVANTLPAVQLRVSASEDRWERLTVANFRAIVDLKGRGAREQGVAVRVEVTGASGVRVLAAIPATVLVNLEDLTARDVPVSTRLVGTLPRGYELRSAVPDRETVRVSGPESLVALVQEAQAEVNITGLTVGIEESAQLIPVASSGGEIRGVVVDPPTAQVAVAVDQTRLLRTLPLEVQLEGDPAPGYRVTGVAVSPATVQVEGAIDVLLGLDALALALALISIDGATETVRSTVRVPVTAGLTARTESATVLVTIEAVPGSTSISVVPTVAGLDPTLVARVEAAVTAVLEGPLPLLNALAAVDVRVTVDAQGLPAGRLQLPVTVTAPEGLRVRDVQPEAVFVTLEPK